MESVKYQRLALQNIQIITKMFTNTLIANYGKTKTKQCALESVNALMCSDHIKKYLNIIPVAINNMDVLFSIAYSHETEIVKKRLKVLSL